MKLRRQTRDTSTGQWAPETQAVSDPAGTVTETIRPVPRCPCCNARLRIDIQPDEGPAGDAEAD